MDKAIATCRKVVINQMITDDLTCEAVEIVDYIEPSDTIIDIRHPDEKEIQPFFMANQAVVLTIPFYQLRTKFADLNQEKNYLLYCEKGVMSQLHAMYLRNQGHENVKVFHPST